MVALSWLTPTLGAVGTLLHVGKVSAKGEFRIAPSPSYRNFDPCPARCSTSGPNTGNWSAYPTFQQIKRCPETMFYDFSLYDEVDDDSSSHRINACSSFGTDFTKSTSPEIETSILAQPVDVDFQIGWWKEGFGLAASSLRSLIAQMREYADNGYGATNRSFIMFGQSGQATIGLYIGQGLLNQAISASAMRLFEDNLDKLNVSTPSLAMQLCGPDYDSKHIFGIMVTSNGTFTPIQTAIKAWANATCLTFSGSTVVTGQATFTTPLLPTNGTANSTLLNSTALSGVSIQHQLHKRLPNSSPSQGPDGACYKYQVVTADNCDDLAARFGLTRDQIEEFNKNTWGWNGCEILFVGVNMCLSKGTPPFPAPIANAQCGPHKPGSQPPSDGGNIADLNPCPLNACCNIWGQCGITRDFCIDTNTGAPGTAKTGTYGCISNCGTDIVRGYGKGSIKIAYYEGYGMNRDCLLQDASQIDTTKYTHVHFAFGTLTNTYEVETGDVLSTYQFTAFKEIKDAKKILSFGGWDFSTLPATYAIFRDGVTSANRLKMATSIANFIKKHDLDGVDIDWEYPGAPDIPGIPPASKDDGANYLAFLVLLKNLLPGKSVSIAAPSSYWYLKQYPIKAIGKVVDYIVYMTYDLHGQWDADNAHSQEGCSTGNCLRSQTNLTETKQSLAMITKAGVPGHKVIVGITSYGRSYNMAEAGCWGPGCVYTGTRENSHAKKGKCTGTAGYIADAEIEDIVKDRKRAGRVVQNFVDASSNSDILVYDDTQWVSYMSASTKNTRAKLYTAWGFGGTTDWASDLQTFHDVPKPAESWEDYKHLIKAGENPRADHTRNGNWTSFQCDNVLVDDHTYYTPQQQWTGLNADAAWKDIVRIWKDTDRDRGISFSESVSETTNVASDPNCAKMLSSNCDTTVECTQGLDAKDSGPAAQLIFNSFVFIHQMFKSYHDSLFNVAAVAASKWKDLENKFAPIPPEPDHTWDLFLIDLLTLGTLSAAGPFFNNLIKKMPYFSTRGDAFDNAKDTTFTLIGQSTSIAKDLLTLSDPDQPWTADSQDAFSSYMGSVISGWANVSSVALRQLFDGSDKNIDTLWDLISEGKLITGSIAEDGSKGGSSSLPAPMSDDELRANIEKSVFGFAIPALWSVSKAYPFIIDSGEGCDGDNIDKYMDEDSMKLSGSCVDGKKYYLASADGEARKCTCDRRPGGGACENTCRAQKFAAPKGLGSLGDGAFGGITKDDLIQGAVRTWASHNRENGARLADPNERSTFDNLLKVDVTTPGFIRIPVCSPDRAFKSWDTSDKGSSPNYPCDVPQGRNDCQDSSFENETSDASPNVEDCRQIIKNIEEDASTDWTTQVIGHRQREIQHHESCHFGIEASKTNGNVNFVVGGQDVIDIINTAIDRFGSGGKIGAKGWMDCNGNVKAQAVTWGIY